MTEPIKLPPLPEWSKMDDLNGFVPSEIRQHLIEYAQTAIEADRQARGEPVADCYSNDYGDTWEDCPDDIKFVHGLKVGDEYELKAASWAWSERFRVTKVPDETNDNYEVEPVSIRATPQPQQIPEGYTPADMASQGAQGFRDGYSAALDEANNALELLYAKAMTGRIQGDDLEPHDEMYNVGQLGQAHGISQAQAAIMALKSDRQQT